MHIETLKAVIDTSPDGVILVGSDSVVLIWNAEMARLTGLTADEAVGLRLRDISGLFMSDSATGYSHDWQGDMAEVMGNDGEHEDGFVMHLTMADGQRRILQGRLKKVETDDGPRVILFFRDITGPVGDAERYRQLFNEVNDPILINDLEGSILSANSRFLERYGYDLETVCQLRLSDIDTKKESILIADRFAELERAGRAIFETVHRDAAGREFPVEVSARVIEYGGLPSVMSIIRDITVRRRHEEAVIMLNRGLGTVAGADFFDSLVTAAGTVLGADLIHIGKISRDDPGTIKVLAASIDGEPVDTFSYQLAGTPGENVVGKHLCVYPENVRELFPDDDSLIESGSVGYVGSPLFNSKGESLGIIAALYRHPIPEPEVIASVVQLLAMRAATELERLIYERRLIQSEQFNRQVLASLDEGIAVYSLDMEVLDWNPRIEYRTGIKAADAVGKKIFELFPDTDRAAITDSFERVSRGETVVFRALRVSPVAPQEDFYADRIFSPFLGVAGDIIGVIAQTIDVTDKVIAEAALHEQEAMLTELIGSSNEAMAISCDNLIMMVNRAYLDLFGFQDEKDIIGRLSPLDLVTDDERQRLEMIATGQRGGAPAPGLLLVSCRRYDGRPFDAEIRISSHDLGGVIYSLSMVRDITRDKEMEIAIKRESSLNYALAELATTVLDRGMELAQIAGVTLDYARELTKSEEGYAGTIDPASGVLVSHTLTRMMGKACNITGSGETIAFPAADDGVYPTLWGHALNTKKPFFTNDPPAHDASQGLPKGHVALRNFLSAPAIVDGRLVGQIALANKRGGYDENDLNALKQLTDIYGLIVERRMAESRALLSQASIDGAMEGIVWADEDGNVTYMNDILRRSLGGVEVIGCKLWSLADNISPKLWQKRWRQLKDEGAHEIEMDIVVSGEVVPKVRIKLNMVQVEARAVAVLLLSELPAQWR